MGKYIDFIKKDYKDNFNNDLSILEYNQIIYSLKDIYEVNEFIKERKYILSKYNIIIDEKYNNKYIQIITNIIIRYPYYNIYTLMNDLVYFNKNNNIDIANNIINLLGYKSKIIDKDSKYIEIETKNNNIYYNPLLRINYKDKDILYNFPYFKVLRKEDKKNLEIETSIDIMKKIYFNNKGGYKKCIKL